MRAKEEQGHHVVAQVLNLPQIYEDAGTGDFFLY